MQKVGILSHTQNPTDRPQRYVSKNAAAALLRRLLAVRITKTLIQMVHVQEGGRPARATVAPTSRQDYQHHIEPKFYELNWGNSAWLRYLHGYEEYEAG